MIERLIRIRSCIAGCLRPSSSSILGEPHDPGQKVTQRELVDHITKITNWETKMEILARYDYSEVLGVWLKKDDSASTTFAENLAPAPKSYGKYCKINYGCGDNIIEDWLNVDLYYLDVSNYRQINLLEKHPFPTGQFEFAFSEDVLEHMNQAESIFFLSEIYRTLAPGGVLRLSFPGLEGVLKRHYTPASEAVIRLGEFEAYTFWDHINFYSRDQLELVAKHLGFREVKFVDYGKSEYTELCGLDTRENQIGLSTYAELAK